VDQSLKPKKFRSLHSLLLLFALILQGCGWEHPGQKEVHITFVGHTRGPKSAPFSLHQDFTQHILPHTMAMDGLILGGDLTYEGGTRALALFKKTVGDAVNFPVINAPGNHDYGPGHQYRKDHERYFGVGPWVNRIGSCLLFTFNTELALTPQARVLDNVLHEVADDPYIANIILVSHRLIWLFGKKRFEKILPYTNQSTRDLLDIDPSQRALFWKRIHPMLVPYLRHKRILFLSGDIGQSLPILYGKEGGMVFVASGLHSAPFKKGEHPWNHYIEIIAAVDQMILKLHPLPGFGIPLRPLEEYTPEFWIRNHQFLPSRTRITLSQGKGLDTSARSIE